MYIHVLRAAFLKEPEELQVRGKIPLVFPITFGPASPRLLVLPESHRRGIFDATMPYQSATHIATIQRL